MKLLRVFAKNFRTLKHLEVAFPDNYCTISGRNNAGKSAVVKIIQYFLEDESSYIYHDERKIQYGRDTTQWDSGQIEIGIEVSLHRDADAELYFFIDKFAPERLSAEESRITLRSIFSEDGSETTVFVDANKLDERSSTEIAKKFRSASNIIVHNSTNPRTRAFYFDDDIVEIIESQFSHDDNKQIEEAQKVLQSRVQAAAGKHKEVLGKYLGRLKERYDVELSPPGRSRSASILLGVKLTDRSVEVPLREWGSGTQNRTRALISILGAARARESVAPSDRVTPIVVVEEPESFLHPSAQAEFGRILNQLSSELSVQLIATTHSPYMLNQVNPAANILLDRKNDGHLLRETLIIDTAGKNWMRPFAENLGVLPDEFSPLHEVFARASGRVLLVEGPVDQEYFEFLKTSAPSLFCMPNDVQIVPYGGKDALKNTTLLKFVLDRFDRTYITFDLDAERECRPALERLGLREKLDFLALGINKAGQECIEGYMPASVKSKVFAENPDLVMALNAQDSGQKKSAKSNMKRKILEEFKGRKWKDEDLRDFHEPLRIIAAGYTQSSRR